MSLLTNESAPSPVQHHEIEIATEVFWAQGQFESLGDPHNYINQENSTFLKITDGTVTPWSFTGLPATHPETLVNVRESVHLLHFTSEETNEQYRDPPRSQKMFLYFPLFVVQGEVPMLSEADMGNFLDFWKGVFVPIQNAALHFLAGGAVQLPRQTSLLYVNRTKIQGYFGG
jgi:hypothetical protein